MAIQTTVSNDPTIAVEGMFAEGGPRDIVSKKAAVAINNGRFVVQGTADDQCKLPTVTGDVTGKPLGLAVYDASLTPAWPASTGEPYPIGSGVSILRKGRAWVKVEEAVAPFDPVFVRFAAGGGRLRARRLGGAPVGGGLGGGLGGRLGGLGLGGDSLDGLALRCTGDEGVDVVDELVGQHLHRLLARPSDMRRDDQIGNRRIEQNIALLGRLDGQHVEAGAGDHQRGEDPVQRIAPGQEAGVEGQGGGGRVHAFGSRSRDCSCANSRSASRVLRLVDRAIVARVPSAGPSCGASQTQRRRSRM